MIAPMFALRAGGAAKSTRPGPSHGPGVGLPGVAWVLSLVFTACHAVASEHALSYETDLKPFLREYCYSCHGREKQRAEVDLERLPEDAGFATHRELWEKVRHALESREMPPDNRPQPSESLRRSMIEGIGAELERIDAALPPHAGAVTIRRLNRNEYRNTIRDLLGIDFDTTATFPHDESGYGFDNIGDVLSLPPMLLEKYLAAAEEIAKRAILTEDPALKRTKRVAADAFSTASEEVARREDSLWGLYREGEITTEYEIAEAGDYVLRLKVYGEQAGPELPRMGVRVDGTEVHVQTIRAVEGTPEVFEVPVRFESGKHRLAVAFLNNFNTDGDRNVFLSAFDIAGPLGAPAEEYPASHRSVLPRRPTPGDEKSYASESIRSFASRAYRRPATEAEVDRLLNLYEMVRKDGGDFEEGIQFAVQAVLVSPHFLYRWELDPKTLEPGEVRDLNGFEVASRLSYFLWSSMPDAELFHVAADNSLTRPDVLEQQVRRMLRDEKARALVLQFGGQWLQIRNLDQAEPDDTVFPAWDESLRDAMRKETESFLWAIIQEDRPIQQLIDADFTYLNERLARHYGIDGIQGDEFRRVNLPPGSPRGGVVTMASVLTVTSVPTRTAPVLRGKWILEQILGTPPPPPPPDVPPLEESAGNDGAATLRQRLELHRSKAECMGCHQKMDPLGFALENFDGIGGWRTQDGPHPIDNAAELPNGRQFTGAAGLKEVLRENDAFPGAFAAKLLTYALGRGLEGYDRRALKEITENASKNGFKFSSLVLQVASSEPFLRRQPQPARHEQHASLSP